MDDLIFIPGSVPSSKNSKVKTSRGIFHSPTVMRYIRSLGIQHYSVTKKTVRGYKDPLRPNIIKQIFDNSAWEKPEKQVIIALHFVRKTKANFDFHNISQIVFDLLVAHDYIEDDSMNWVVPLPLKINGKFFSKDKDKPGVYIKLIRT